MALTPGGLLMKLSLSTLDVEEVIYPETPIVCLGTGGDAGLLAGGENGSIYRVDVPTMTLTRVARAPSPPVAVAAYRASPSVPPSIVVVTSREVHDLGTGRRWELDYLANRITTHLDGKARLWIGTDNGEWGGWVARLDLRSGELKVYPDCLTESRVPSRDFSPNQFQCQGVYGLTELRNGSLWAHGGTTHLGLSSAWIGRLDDAGIVDLYENQGSLRGEVRRSEKPRAPITHILEHPTTGELYVVAFSEVFRAERRLSRFRLAYELDLRYRAGRPDAVGAYPSVTSIDWIESGDQLLVSTSFDGLLRLSGGRQLQHAFAGELGATRIDRMEPSNEGIVFFEGDTVWQRSAGDWSTKTLEPPASPKFELRELSAFGSWQTELAFVDAGGDLVSVSETNLSPGPRATIRWRGGEAEILKIEEDYDGHLVSGFATPDGELWAASRRGLYRFTKNGWVHATALTLEGGAGMPRLRALATPRPPWFLLESTSGKLFRLRDDAGVTTVRSLSDGAMRIHDAVRWKNDWVLATSEGLRTYDFREHEWSSFDSSLDDGVVRVLATDGARRLWLGGAGLWVVVGGRVVDLSELPALAGVEILDLIDDPHFLGGVIASIAERGLLYVRVE